MKTIHSKLFAQLLAGLALATFGASSFADSTWAFPGVSCLNGGSTTTLLTTGSGCAGKDTTTNATDPNKVHATAWATTAGTQFASATLEASSGNLRVKASTEGMSAPNHAMDNYSKLELIAFQFDSAITLDKIVLSWSQNDADITVMAYTGAGVPSSFIAGKTAANINTGIANGWTLVENSGDVDSIGASTCNNINIWNCANSQSSTRIVNAANVSSSWWLISAYSSSLGGGNLDSVSDFVKIQSISSKTPTNDTPEPGSIALFGLGLIGMVASRRRPQKAA
jgi:PEP-CTERM motif